MASSAAHMTPQERTSSFSLASIFALRMFGLFIILPVFAVYARELPGGDSETLVGITLGIYGLTQGLLQIPFGVASDRLGRKPVIIFGLIIFALGSFLAASGANIWIVMLGRMLQGAGAISAAVTAFIADSVRVQVLTKAMAMVGASIGLTFAPYFATAHKAMGGFRAFHTHWHFCPDCCPGCQIRCSSGTPVSHR